MPRLIEQVRLHAEAVARQREKVVDFRLAQQRSCCKPGTRGSDPFLHKLLGLALGLNGTDWAKDLPMLLEPKIRVVAENKLIPFCIGEGICGPGIACDV